MNAPLTIFATDIDETEKTVETNIIGNDDFLRVVFGDDLDDARPLLVSFAGDPRKVPKKCWIGRPWGDHDDDAELPPDRNNYFSLAVFRPDEAGVYRRRKARFQALHAVMLDDVGQKVDPDRLTLPPSWLLETSEGNHQTGYLLAEPLSDGATADRLMDAIVDAGLCDPGANGPRARLARLPVAVNGKHAPPFRCRMVEWAPKRRYTVEELATGLQLEMKPPGRPRPQSNRPMQEQPVDGDPVWIPRPAKNAVLAALRARGLYKTPLGDGKHDITCPWVNEHTDAVDGGTAYFEPDEHWPIGGFKCLHGHCAERHIRELLDHLGIAVGAARMTPMIRVVAGELHRIVDAAERELAASRRYYQAGGLIVAIHTDPGSGEARIAEISQPALLRALAGAVTWERYDARARDWVRTDPPERHVTVLYKAHRFPHLPVLRGLTRQPYLRHDGSLMTEPGYDSASGRFGVFDAGAFAVPDHPSRADAEAALALLLDLLAEFRFVSPSDRSAALSALLTAAIRTSLAQAPMYHARAYMVGSGKTYLCELITAFATPKPSTPTTFPGDEEECRKLLLAELLGSPAVIEFDNLTGDLLAHKTLCTVLTSEYLTGRILGISKTATVSTRTLFLSSGNNVGPIQDMTRRCVTIHLDPGCELPATRTFRRPELVEEVLRERGRYVSAALTVVRAWIVAGRPQTPCRALAGFGEWSALCRQPLLWLGCADPAASVFEAMADDPDRETLERLLGAWQAVFGKAPAMVRDALREGGSITDPGGALLEVLQDIAEERGEINRRRLGRWIKRHAGRIVDGRRFVRASGSRSAEAWRVESVSAVSSDAEPPRQKTVTSSRNAYARASRGE